MKTEKEIIQDFVEAALNLTAMWNAFHNDNERRRKNQFLGEDIAKFIIQPPETSDTSSMTQLRKALTEAQKLGY